MWTRLARLPALSTGIVDDPRRLEVNAYYLHFQAADEAAVLLHGPAQHVERARAAVDEVAHQPQAVLAGIEGDAAQQAFQGLEAAMDVADRVGRHGHKDLAAGKERQGRARTVMDGHGGFED